MPSNSSGRAHSHGTLGSRHTAWPKTGRFGEDVVNDAVSLKSARVCGGISVDKLKLDCVILSLGYLTSFEDGWGEGGWVFCLVGVGFFWFGYFLEDFCLV